LRGKIRRTAFSGEVNQGLSGLGKVSPQKVKEREATRHELGKNAEGKEDRGRLEKNRCSRCKPESMGKRLRTRASGKKIFGHQGE